MSTGCLWPRAGRSQSPLGILLHPASRGGTERPQAPGQGESAGPGGRRPRQSLASRDNALLEAGLCKLSSAVHLHEGAALRLSRLGTGRREEAAVLLQAEVAARVAVLLRRAHQVLLGGRQGPLGKAAPAPHQARAAALGCLLRELPLPFAHARGVAVGTQLRLLVAAAAAEAPHWGAAAGAPGVLQLPRQVVKVRGRLRAAAATSRRRVTALGGGGRVVVDRTGFAELRAGTQGCLLRLLLVLATAAAASVILGTHAAALLLSGAQISAVKSLGAAEAQMRYIGELKLETLAALQACVRGRPCLVSKQRARARAHTHTHTHDYSASSLGQFAITPSTNPLSPLRV